MSDYICDELIAEIFERLPPKSVVRCRSLSKYWYSHIVSPGFIRRHTLQSAKNPQKVIIRHQIYKRGGMDVLYTLHSEDRLPMDAKNGYIGITPIKFPVGNGFDIVGSCNGILCLFASGIGITLWNPSIRYKLTLPHHSSLRNSSKEGSRCVAIGFGFDPVANDYKIVRISFSPIGEGAPQSLIYTINTGAWRAITSPPPFYYMDSMYNTFICASFVNGSLHWVVQESNNTTRRFIMSFDVSNEVFGKIQLPEPEVDWPSRQVMIMEGSLAVISSDGLDSWIWVMKEYNNVASWSMVFKLKAVQCQGPVDIVYFRTTNGHLVFNAYSQGFKVYNPATRVQSKLVNYKDDCKIVDMETCAESILLLDRGTPCIGNGL